MPIQNYQIYTDRGYAGDQCDSTSHVTKQTGIIEDATMGFGLAVVPGTGERGITVGHTAGVVHGITLRELNTEAANKPSDGTAVFKKTDSLTIMQEGFIYVLVSGVEAAVAGAYLNVDDATGAFTGGTAGVGETASLNVKAVQGGAPGDVIKARIDFANPA